MGFFMRKIIWFIVINIICFYSLRWYYDTRTERVYQHLQPTIVHIYTFAKVANHRNLKIVNRASGVVIGKHGLILTCAHVITDGQVFYVVNNKIHKEQAYAVNFSSESDVGLIQLCHKAKSLHYAKLGSEIKVGTPVFSISYPGYFGICMTNGIIAKKGKIEDVSTTPIDFGSSGGGLFNLNGELVGLTSAIYAPNGEWQGLSFNVSRQAIKEIVDKYKELK
jgi:serine protease Do